MTRLNQPAVLSKDGKINFSKGYFRQIIDILPSYLCILNKDLRIIFTNQSFIKDFGEKTGQPCHIAYKGSDRRCPVCPVQETFIDKGVHLSENEVETLQGDVNQVIIYSAPILDKYGNLTSVMEMVTNISKVKAMRKELTAIGKSIAIISHGVKNILEGLQGSVYIIDEAIKDNDMALLQKGWNIAKNNITDISSVVQDILYSSKKKELILERVWPQDLVKQTVSLFQKRAELSGIMLNEDVNPNLPMVNLDSFCIRRMLNNLVANAIEACKKGSDQEEKKVFIRAEFHSENQFKFEVEDNGVGITEETKKRIFREFFSTKGSCGTGLGLVVVQKIVTEHKARIEIESERGHGSLFRIIFNI